MAFGAFLKGRRNTFLLISLQVFLISGLIFLFNFFPVLGDVGGNVTVITQLEVGNSYPEVVSVTIEEGAGSFTLTPADTKTLTCVAVVRDYEGFGDIKNVTAQFFDNVASGYGQSDDNNDHYTNDSCSIDTSYGDAYTAQANCTFEVEYYANPETWNCTVMVNDTADWTDVNSSTITVSQLLALGLPSTINYGTVNATFVSNENITNVTNYGNVQVNLSLSGYAQTEEDGLAMNCSLGNVGTIDLDYEKFNLTSTTLGDLSLSEFEDLYINLTDTPVVKEFNLASRTDDLVNNAIKSTYWRIYVPRGVAGTCEGNIVFGATTSVES